MELTIRYFDLKYAPAVYRLPRLVARRSILRRTGSTATVPAVVSPVSPVVSPVFAAV
jgi:hypothetical protein